MTTITLKINERKKAGKTFMELLEIFRTQDKAVEIVNDGKSPYNPEFVAMVKKAAASKKRTRVTNVKQWIDSL